MIPEPFEEQLERIQPSPTKRFHKRMARAPWSAAGRIRQQLYAGVGLAILLLSASVILTPQGRAWAQEVLHFFTRAASDTRPVTPMPPGEDWAWTFELGLGQAEQLTGINASVPTWVPDTLVYDGAMADPSRRIILISYNYLGMEGTGLVLLQQAVTEDNQCEICDIVGASADVQVVLVGDVQGEYVTGVWKAIGDTGQWGWDDEPFMQRLRWQANGMAYEIMYMAPPESLRRDEMVTIAASLSSDQKAKAAFLLPLPTDTPGEVTLRTLYPLDRFEAQQQARFTVLMPSWMPANFSLGGAACEQGEHPIVHLVYPDAEKFAQSGENGLRLSERLVANGTDCDLCGFILGDWSAAEVAYEFRVVGENAVIEEVTIGSARGMFVQGFWEPAGEGGFQWVNDPAVSVLRWQSNGVALQIAYFGEELTLEELIKIAESIH
jgi:hypothetical protein